MINRSSAYQDKVEAKGEKTKAKIMELKAKLKEAGADARIAIQNQIDRLQARLNI